jgi:hypothetical protein
VKGINSGAGGVRGKERIWGYAVREMRRKNQKKTPAKLIAGVLLWSKYDLKAG